MGFEDMSIYEHSYSLYKFSDHISRRILDAYYFQELSATELNNILQATSIYRSMKEDFLERAAGEILSPDMISITMREYEHVQDWIIRLLDFNESNQNVSSN